MSDKTNPQNKPVANVNGWFLTPQGGLIATECNDHPALGQCTMGIRTSRVVSTDGKTYAETLNTFYKLGTPMKELAEVCIPLDIGN